jgi:cell division septum initiation protein DivIVA
VLAQLTAQVDRLIAENRDLKRAIARVQQAAGGLGESARTLAGLQRRVSQALASDGRVRGRGRGAEPAATPKPRRKVTDPEVLERRRAALAKARAARAAKRRTNGG